MSSIWVKDCSLPAFAQLKEDISADVAVIGGGMAGLLIAHRLSRQGCRVVVLEARRIAGGVTQNTTAKITAQHRLIYHKLTKKMGQEQAQRYAQANQAAVAEFGRIITSQGINCDYQAASAAVYTMGDPEPLQQEAEAAVALGLPARFGKAEELPFDTKGAVFFDGQARFHPLKFLSAIAQELTIYENTPAQEVEAGLVRTPGGTVKAAKVVVATHYPFINTPGYYFLRMQQSRSYVVALEGVGTLNGMYIDEEENGFSLRGQGKMILLGGGSHKTGDNRLGGQYRRLEQQAVQWFPGAKVTARWSAQDCMTLDDLPYIGQYASQTPYLYVATGFDKWGMTGSMVSALLLADLIAGRQNAWQPAFDPTRFELGPSFKKLAQAAADTVSGFAARIAPPVHDAEHLPPGHGGVVAEDGKKRGVSKDEQGNVKSVCTVCTHLGCQLEWNPDERSWDCPCHGSRFDENGGLLDGPAQRGLDHAP